MQRLCRMAVALFCVLLPVAPSGAGKGSDDLEKWVVGPIRYIIRADEAKVYRDLETDEQRSLFIERFWARRDPTPSTLTSTRVRPGGA